MTSPLASPRPKVGTQAPAFDLPSHIEGADSGQIKLSDFAGKKNVILAFYPKDDTPGCTKEMCAFSQDLKAFEEADTQLLGISCDKVESHKKFAGKYDLKQPLLSDVGGVTGKAYGTVDSGKSTASRVLFVIDKSGTIRHIIEGMPSNSELLELVRAL